MRIDKAIWRWLEPHRRKSIWHWVLLVAMIWLGFAGGQILKDSPRLTDFRYWIYAKQLKAQNRGTVYPRRVSIVLLQDGDYWGNGLQGRTPLKRDQLAKIIDRLNEADVDSIGLDVDLRSPIPADPGFDFPDYNTRPSTPDGLSENAALYKAIDGLCARHHFIVLAASVAYLDGGYQESPSIYTNALAHSMSTDPEWTDPAKKPCVSPGYIQLPRDVRTIPGRLDLDEDRHLDSFSLALTRLSDIDAYQRNRDGADDDRGFRFSQYLTEQDFEPQGKQKFIFSAADIMEGDPTDLHNQLGGRIVLIGAKWHQDFSRAGEPPDVYRQGVFVDTHGSPGGNQPGVMLHANYVESMLDRTGTFTPLTDRTGEAIELALIIILALIGDSEMHAGWKWGAFTTGILASIAMTYVLLQNLGIFLDFGIPLIMVFLHKLFDGIIEMAQEVRKHTHASGGVER